MEEMKILTVNGESYEVVDAKARNSLGDVEAALDSILAIQNALLGGESA